MPFLHLSIWLYKFLPFFLLICLIFIWILSHLCVLGRGGRPTWLWCIISVCLICYWIGFTDILFRIFISVVIWVIGLYFSFLEIPRVLMSRFWWSQKYFRNVSSPSFSWKYYINCCYFVLKCLGEFTNEAFEA